MRTILRLAVAVTWCVAARAQSDQLTTADRVAIAQRIYQLVQQNFAHWEGTSRSRVDAAYREYLLAVERAVDRRAFDLASLRFVAALRNGHSQFVDAAADNRPLKFRLLQAEGEWAVIFSQDARLRRGAVVRTLDGTPIDAVVIDFARYVAASNDRLARTHVFSYPMLFLDRISLGLKTGETVLIDRSVRGDGAPFRASTQSEGRWIDQGRLAYIKIPSFADSIFENSALDLVDRFSTASTLIVDVRGNGGGTTPGRLIASLMNRPFRTWRQLAPSPRPSRVEAAPVNAFHGRLFVLIDRFCGSACEDFVMPFKDNHRATLVGETTQGSSGNPYREDLGHGIRVAIGAVRYAFPNGKPFEGIGIEPDVTVDRRLTDLRTGRDAILETAQVLAGRK